MEIKKRVVFGDKYYKKFEDLPEEVKRKLRDIQRNGGNGFGTENKITYDIDGKKYENLSDLPDDVRLTLEDRNNDGIADVFQMPPEEARKKHPNITIKNISNHMPDVIREDTPSGVWFVVLVVAALAGLVYFIAR
ncbi:MAG: hypothetical protein JW803_09485 [Endomicrobiales bacterium]|nr:hypothetical protein [Endomicrobiales bacterium]